MENFFHQIGRIERDLCGDLCIDISSPSADNKETIQRNGGSAQGKTHKFSAFPPSPEFLHKDPGEIKYPS